MDNAAGNHSMRSPKEALVDLDAFLGQVGAAGIPVDVIPGKYDPTNANWPQRPLHKSLLPVSCRSSSRNRNNSNNGGNGTVLCTPNPYEAKLTLSSNNKSNNSNHSHQHQQILMVGNDGAALQDVRQVLGGKQQNNDDEIMAVDATATATELEALKATFSFSHTCPTSPDSLGAMPLVDGTDPNVLTERPHLYFAGNCTQFATCTVSGTNNDDNDMDNDMDDNDMDDTDTTNMTRLVCIPRFSQTGQAVLVHLQSLDCQVLEFKPNQED
eukprot:scaffold31191_cov41-Attheya_sp.AAC.1